MYHQRHGNISFDVKNSSSRSEDFGQHRFASLLGAEPSHVSHGRLDALDVELILLVSCGKRSGTFREIGSPWRGPIGLLWVA